MKRCHFHRALGVLLCGWACVAGAEPATVSAAEHKPLVVISLASYERLIQDANAAFDPRLTALAQELFGRIYAIPTDPRTMAPAGLDTRRPWGLVVKTDGHTFPLDGFIPVTDLGALLAGPVASRRIGPPVNGVYKIEAADRNWYVGQKGAWAIFASSPQGLAAAPADPAGLLRGLDRSRDLAVRVLLKNLPEDVREIAGRWVKENHYLDLPKEHGESDLVHVLRNAAANQGLRWAAELATEGENLSVGLSLDLRARKLIADAEITYRRASEMAQSLAAPSNSKTEMAGFLVPGAAMSGVWTGEVARMPLYQILGLCDSVVEQLLPPSRKEAASGLWKVIREELLAESVDGGIVLVTRSGRPTLAAGGYVADPEVVRSKLGAFLEAARKSAASTGLPPWRHQGSPYRGVRFHTLAIPSQQNAGTRRRPASGDAMEVAIGIGEHHVYVAAGQHPVRLLKEVVRGSLSRTARKGPPVVFTFSLAKLAGILADSHGGNGPWPFARMAELLKRSGGRDHATLTAVPIRRGTHLRLEVEEGVLRSATFLGNEIGWFAP